MEYIGEHLLPGKIGHFFALLSLVASLVATIAFFKANRHTDPADRQSWLKIARISFLLETIAVVAMFATLYYIISNHLFEYKYAWQHSDRSLQIEYLLSCFWEGQEGSFMLWAFWHCVLGWFVIWRANQWEAPVMAVISFAQLALASMVIGIYFFGHKVGSSPFVLLRNEVEGPIFSRPDYLQIVYERGGQGLNALLQNYWMVIHPPILFLGFAATIVPFAYAIAGLINRNHDWIKHSLPWANFAAATLGLGIMMGAAWAYESLSFGGYWAWDPVENASLVPWITLIAGLHTNMVYKSTGYSLRTTYFFYVISFILVLYSTFLTRSGVLGDTSVHAFTDLGMNTQLYLFLNIFVWLPALFAAKDSGTKLMVAAGFVVANIISFYFPWFTLVSIIGAFVLLLLLLNKHVPAIRKEENTYSREFWMYIGALVLFLSAVIIIFQTSLPVLNKLINQQYAPPDDIELQYNQVQIFVAIIIGLLTATSQYLKFKDTPREYFGRRILIPTVISVLISLAISIFGGVSFSKHGPGFLFAIHLAIFAAVYAIVANAAYIWISSKKLKGAGASVAHIGFGMMLLGILISSSKKDVLSHNTTGIAVFKKEKGGEDPLENITLFKGQPTDMGKHMVTYVNDYLNAKDRKRYYQIDFAPKDGSKKFTLYPNVIKNNKGEGFSANPDARHYWHKDIFAYLTSFQESKTEDTSSFKFKDIKPGDTVFYSNGRIILDKVGLNPTGTKHKIAANDTLLVMDLTILTHEGAYYKAYPALKIEGGEVRILTDTVQSQSLVFQYAKVVDPSKGMHNIGIKESKALLDLVTLKVYEFPMINLLWLGIVIMFIGFILSVYKRVDQLRLRTLPKK